MRVRIYGNHLAKEKKADLVKRHKRSKRDLPLVYHKWEDLQPKMVGGKRGHAVWDILEQIKKRPVLTDRFKKFAYV
jgi:hypothetical protein